MKTKFRVRKALVDAAFQIRALSFATYIHALSGGALILRAFPTRAIRLSSCLRVASERLAS